MHFRDFFVVFQRLIESHELEGVPAVLRQRKKLPVLSADIINEKRFSVSGLADEYKGHLGRRITAGRALYEMDEIIDLIVPSDDMLFSFAEKRKIVDGFAGTGNFYRALFQNHPRNALRGIFEFSFPVQNLPDVET